MNIDLFKIKLRKSPNSIVFSETMAVIDGNYKFEPTAFNNGELHNAAGENSGSCKVFAYALKLKLSESETLACFGQYYFEDVLKDPNGSGHQNIRNFMKTGFDGLNFHGQPLSQK